MEILNYGGRSGGTSGSSGGMGGFFDKILKLVSKELVIRELIADSIKEVTNVVIQANTVSVKGVVANVKVTSNVKNLIFIKKSKILEVLKIKIAEKNIDIVINDIQ